MPDDRGTQLALWQEGIWLQTQLNPDDAVYTLARPMAVHGDIDEARLRRALETVARRHEPLRTTVQPGSPPMLCVSDSAHVELRTFTALGHDAAVQFATRLAAKTFDLTTGPLWRVALIQFGPAARILLLTWHHLIADGVSITLLSHDIAAAYEGTELPELTTQYTGFATRQRRWLTSARREKQLAFWRNHLTPPPPPLNLPRRTGHQGERESVDIGFDLRTRLVRQSRRHRVTLFVTMLSAYAYLLGTYCGARDLIVACPVSQRNSTELDLVMGLFINTAPVRVRLDNEMTFADLATQVRERMLDAYDNLDVPYSEILRATGPVSVLFQVTDFQERLIRRLGAAEVRPFDLVAGRVHHDLELSVVDHGDRLRVNLDFPVPAWDRRQARDFLGYYLNVLNSALEGS